MGTLARAERPTEIPAADWHALFDAVKYRLLHSATDAAAVRDCVDALDRLQAALPPDQSRSRERPSSPTTRTSSAPAAAAISKDLPGSSRT